MTYIDRYNRLLRSLHRLYSKLGFLHLQKQLQRHRRKPSKVKQHSISASLVEHIDRLANHKDAPLSCELERHEKLNKSNRQDQSGSRRKFNLSSSVAVNVDNFFRKNKHLSGSAAGMSETLKESAWNHMRCALRLAKQGQIHSAKIHANIADQAVKEVAHFMPEDEYEAFSAEIKKALRTM